jgi:hypothetical protein
LTFDGTNDWVTVADVPSLDLTSALTLEAWVYPTFSSDCARPDEGARGVLSVSAARNGTTPNLPALGLALGGTTRRPSGRRRCRLNTWTHLAATYDGAAMRVYVNGALAARAPSAGCRR